MTFPPVFYSTPGVAAVANALSGIPNLPAKLVFCVLISIAFFGVLTFIYAWLYKLVGPPRYLPIDEPPMKVKTKRYKR